MSALQKRMSLLIFEAVAPALIMLLIGSLIFFCAEVVYYGQHLDRLKIILAWWVFGSVLVCRIAITEGRERSVMFGMALAAVVLLALLGFVEIRGALSMLALPIHVAFILVSWWCASKLTWDCTVVDTSRDTTSRGLLSRLPWIDPERGDAAEDENEEEVFGATDQESAGSRAESKAGTFTGSNLFRMIVRMGRQRNTPGLTVIYFSLAAIPIFGLGQGLIAASNTDGRQFAFQMFVCYISAALGLLLTTSLLSLQQYLFRRDVAMPNPVALTWVATGAIAIIAILTAAWILPRPYPEHLVGESPIRFDAPEDLSSSKWAMFGNDGPDDQKTNRVNQDREKTGDQVASKGKQKSDAGRDDSNSDRETSGGKNDGSSKGKSGKKKTESPGKSKSKSKSKSAGEKKQSQQSSKKKSESEKSKGPKDSKGEKSESKSSQSKPRNKSEQNKSEQNKSEQSKSEQKSEAGKQPEKQQQADSKQSESKNESKDSEQKQSEQKQSDQKQSESSKKQDGKQSKNNEQQSEQNNKDEKKDQQQSESEQNESENQQSQQDRDNQNNDQKNEQEQSDKQDDSNQSDEESKPDKKRRQSDQQQSQQAANEQPRQKSALERMHINRSFGALMTVLRWLFYLVAVCFGAWFAWKYRERIAIAWRNFVQELKDLIDRLLGRGNQQEVESAEFTEEAIVKLRSLREFRDPFATGMNRKMTHEEIVRYSFAALEAWGNDHGLPRQEDRTPHEYAKQIVKRQPRIGREVQRIVELYSEMMFANPDQKLNVSAEDQKRLAKLWKKLQSLDADPLPVEIDPLTGNAMVPG